MLELASFDCRFRRPSRSGLVLLHRDDADGVDDDECEGDENEHDDGGNDDCVYGDLYTAVDTVDLERNYSVVVRMRAKRIEGEKEVIDDDG